MSEVKKEKTKTKVVKGDDSKIKKSRTTRKTDENKKEKKTKKSVSVAKKATDDKKTNAKLALEKEEKKIVEKTKKNEVVLLNENDSHCYYVLCKLIRIFSTIGRICLMILVPFIFVAMIIAPIILSKVEYDANIIKFKNTSIILRDNGISVKTGDTVHVIECSTGEIDRLIAFISNNSNGTITFLTEMSLLIFGIVITLEIYLLSYLEKLFSNFEKSKMPFTSENSKYILSIAKLLVSIKVAAICLSMFGLYSSEITSISIFELLIAFVIYYLFKYASGMQKEISIN